MSTRRRAKRACVATPPKTPRCLLGFVGADRKSLLLGTALASTLLLGTMTAPTPAHAIPCVQPASPNPISDTAINADITCVNTVARTGDGVDLDAIRLDTNPGGYIYLNNSGLLTSPTRNGIYTTTNDDGDRIDIINSGDIDAAADGIEADTSGSDSPIFIRNSGDIDAEQGINADALIEDSNITILNSGAIKAEGEGIEGDTYGINSSILIDNSGTIVTGEEGLNADTHDDNSKITIFNSGKITAGDEAIEADTSGDNSDIRIVNSGDIASRTPAFAFGIRAFADYENSSISIENSGDVTATSSLLYAAGIVAITDYNGSPISITNSGNVTLNGAFGADGVGARTYGSAIDIVNSGDVTATAATIARGLVGESYGPGGGVTIKNWGKVTTTARFSYGVYAFTDGANSPLTIVNTGDIKAKGGGPNGYALGMFVGTYAPGSPILIQNSGSVIGADAGLHIHAYSNSGATIVNSGDITAQSLLAIDAHGPGDISIFNSGLITGFIRLDADDRFINQAGGVFEARRTSDFGDGGGAGDDDLFRNEAGGTVHANGDTRFVNLERFENSGLISMVDQRPGDSFTISNTVGGTDLDFVASGGSTLAVDAFLGGPGNSSSDTFIIEGNVSGTTTVAINNTNYGPGVFNPAGIPVVFVTGNTPNPNAFQLAEPIDTGFFDYDLFFTPTGSGFWSFKSFPGGGAYLLPQLVTAAQDIWHQGSSTWFDRTADLRVLLAGGAAPTAYDPNAKYADGVPQGPGNFTPAVWARGSGGWLDRDDSVSTSAFGRDYRFDLDRDLQIIDFQMGLDLGTRDLLSQGDVLVFGVLGGFVHADLDYDAIVRQFDFSGGQVGAYATYLKGGLFVDTLLNAHIYELDTATLGFPSSLDANTVGLRTDTGYRFGSFSGGPFLEPLATIEVTWADIDGFSLGGNTVSFDDDANVRGRLGLRAGTTMEAWTGTMMEPFVIGSLWGNLTGDNQATLVSTGHTFRFEDQLEDVWGEVSAGVNFFNPTATTAVFAKLDVTFGDDVTGVGGKAGLRVSW